MQAAVETGIPMHLSYGFICGYCSGYTLKKVGKVAAGIFGKNKLCFGAVVRREGTD